jgi:iron complex outermembrane receptor protein
MKRLLSLALASVSVAAIASTANAAQSSQGPVASAPAEEAQLGEIVVTARRRSESLQEVPQTVNAVTSESLQKLNIKRFEDVQTVVPGLSLTSATNGFSAAASLRGVTFDVTTGAQPTVALYLNDAPVQALFLFQSLFDIGQVEVLKGPQGTTRGISAPSGAITVTNHKPDLSDFGGYIDATATDQHGRNVNGALNVPIIKDVLAVRGALSIDQNDYDGVTSIHSNIRPSQKTTAERFAVSYEPSDAFNANVTYQHMDHNYLGFTQVSGPGPGAIVYPPNVTPSGFPASVNPPIGDTDRLSAQDGASEIRQHFNVVTAQVDSRLFGQHLSYVGSYQHQNLAINNAQDTGNVLPGIEVYQPQITSQTQTTQEIRLASDPAPGRWFDYTVGAFYNWQENAGHVTVPGPLLPGAFGPGLSTINLNAYNPRYSIPLGIDIPSSLQETSLFGSVTFHLPWNTELSGGIRHIWSVASSQTLIQTGNGVINLGGPDITLNTAAIASNFTSHDSETPNIYNVSLSHHFTRDFLVYANTGTAFRPPVTSVGITGDLANATDPVLHSLTFHPAERSRSYEVGFKSTWLDGRARLNASVFQQTFSNLTIFIPGISYFNTTAGAPNNFAFTASVDAKVTGFDVDTAFQITPEWNVSAQMSYADGKVKGSLVPCNDPGVTLGNPATTPGAQLIALCPGGSSSRLPLWNATFTSEYVHPVTDGMDGFIRLLATYYPENKNRAEPDFTVDNYSLINFYLGVRSHDGAWEASIFTRNAFNTQRATDVQNVSLNINTPLGTAFQPLIHNSGYFQTLQTPRREVGINVHYAFGSR